MPQLLNTFAPPELEEAIDKVLSENVPEFSGDSWKSALSNRGININTLADQYIETLHNLKPAAKMLAIERLLVQLGVSKGEEEIKSTPTLIINGDNIQVNQLIAPQRGVPQIKGN